MTIVYLILALVIAVLAVIFALQNVVTITISFFAWKVTGSLSLVLLITLAIGFAIGSLALVPSIIKNTLQVSNHRKRIGVLEKEIDGHKATVQQLTSENKKLAQPEAESESSEAS